MDSKSIKKCKSQSGKTLILIDSIFSLSFSITLTAQKETRKKINKIAFKNLCNLGFEIEI